MNADQTLATDEHAVAGMTIAEAAKISGLPAKTIRYYESIGLIARPPRQPNRYRCYGPEELGELRFISRVRRLGFPLRDIAELLRLWRREPAAVSGVKALASEQRSRVDAEIADLCVRRDALTALIEKCENAVNVGVLDEFASEPVPGS